MVCSERDLLEHTAESQFGTPDALFAQAQSTCMCDHTRKSSHSVCSHCGHQDFPGEAKMDPPALQLLTKKVVEGKAGRGC